MCTHTDDVCMCMHVCMCVHSRAHVMLLTPDYVTYCSKNIVCNYNIVHIYIIVTLNLNYRVPSQLLGILVLYCGEGDTLHTSCHLPHSLDLKAKQKTYIPTHKNMCTHNDDVCMCMHVCMCVHSRAHVMLLTPDYVYILQQKHCL